MGSDCGWCNCNIGEREIAKHFNSSQKLNSILIVPQKLSQQSSSDQPTSEGAAEKPPKPYRSMLPGLGIDKEGEEGEEEEVVEEPSIPTPRKRLMNFKIPLINRGGQRRDQNLSIVARRRLFSEEGEGVKQVLYLLFKDKYKDAPLCSLVPRLHCPAFFVPKCKKCWAVEPGNEATIVLHEPECCGNTYALLTFLAGPCFIWLHEG